MKLGAFPRLLLVVAALLGLALFPVGASSSHETIPLAADESEDTAHGHSHDDDFSGGDGGHSHGQDPADHSHLTPGVAPRTAAIVPSLAQGWPPQPSCSADVEVWAPLDRPPRTSVAI